MRITSANSVKLILGKRSTTLAAGVARVIPDNPDRPNTPFTRGGVTTWGGFASWYDAVTAYIEGKITFQRGPDWMKYQPVCDIAASAAIELATSLAAAETVTIGGVVFTFAAGSGQTNTSVGLGASLANAATNLVAAINTYNAANPVTFPVVAGDNIVVGTSHYILVNSTLLGTLGNAVTTIAKSGSHITIGGNVSAGYLNGGLFGGITQRAVFSQAATGLTMMIPIPFTLVGAQVTVVRSGAILAFDGAITFGPKSITIGDGATYHLSTSTDVIYVNAWGV